MYGNGDMYGNVGYVPGSSYSARENQEVQYYFRCNFSKQTCKGWPTSILCPLCFHTCFFSGAWRKQQYVKLVSYTDVNDLKLCMKLSAQKKLTDTVLKCLWM